MRLGAYAAAALDLDEDCRLAILAQGLGYRACGLYEEALERFQRADESFELFVKGDASSIKNYLGL